MLGELSANEDKEHGFKTDMNIYENIYNTLPGFLKGMRRYCNICGFRFSRFLPFNKRKDAACPLCRCRERHRHLYIHLLSLAPFLNGKNVLHFAPEGAIKNLFKKLNVQYFDADIDPDRATYT